MGLNTEKHSDGACFIFCILHYTFFRQCERILLVFFIRHFNLQKSRCLMVTFQNAQGTQQTAKIEIF